MARNWYSEAIDILHGDYDWKKMIIMIAKKHPKLVVECTKAAQSNEWKSICLDIRESKGKIPAIKECRHLTGMGLSEAKEAVENL